MLFIYMFVFIFFFTFFSLGAVKKGQIVRVDKEKYLNSINVSIRGCLFFPSTQTKSRERKF